MSPISSLDTQNEIHNLACQSASESLTYVERRMLQEAVFKMGGSSNMKSTLTSLISTAKSIATRLPGGGNLHCYITFPSAETPSDFELFPITSKLFRSALDVANPGSVLAAHALRDAFLVAHRVANRNQAKELESYAHRPPFAKQVELPDWFPDTSHPIPIQNVQFRPHYIICNERNMTQMAKLEVESMASLYNSFFKTIWLQACVERKVSGQVSYASVTPP